MKKIDQDAEREKSMIPQEAEAQIVQLLIKFGQYLQRELNPVCRRFGLKQQQFTVLNEIVWQGPISQKELGERLLFEKSNMSKIVRILLEKKLVDVVIAPGDRRLTLLVETRDGAALWKDCMQAFNRFCIQGVSILDERQAAQLTRLLNKLQKGFGKP